MRNRRRVVTIAGAALVGAAAGLVAPLSAHAAASATAWVSSFAITYEAAGGQANSVKTAKVFTSSGEVRWQFTDVVPITAGTGCYHPLRTSMLVWCAPGSALVIGIRTLDLNDAITIGSPNTFVYAGSGDDTIYTPNDPSVMSFLYGEDGSDTVVSGASQDKIDGGLGIDRVSYQNRLAPMCGDLYGWSSPPGGGPLDSACEVDDREDLYLNGSVENLVGGWNDDVFLGNATTNRFDGGPGSDEIHTGGGNDTVYGGPGDDNIVSGPGSNVLHGDAGNDYLEDYGYAGEIDILDGGPDVDTCTGTQIELKIECEL